MKLGGRLIYVKDVERSVAFYNNILCDVSIKRFGVEFAIVALENSSVLYIHRDPEKFEGYLEGLERRQTRGDGAIIHFEVSDLRGWCKLCEEAQISISMGPVAQPFGRTQCYLYDPDGYNIVIEEMVTN